MLDFQEMCDYSQRLLTSDVTITRVDCTSYAGSNNTA